LAVVVLAWDRKDSVVARPVLALADLLALEGAALADIPVVVTVTVPAEDLLAMVARKAALKGGPEVVIVVVPRVDLATAEIADLIVVLLTMAGAAVTEDQTVGLRVIAAARKTKRTSFAVS
jgi:hypothetical protein